MSLSTVSRINAFIIIFLVTAIAWPASNDEYHQLDDEQFQTLITIKNSFNEIAQFEQAGELSLVQAEGARNYVILQHQKQMTTPIALEKLRALVDSCMQDELCSKKSLLDHFKGLFTFINIIWFIASILILVGLYAVLSNHHKMIIRITRPIRALLAKLFGWLGNKLVHILPLLAAIFKRIPAILYELLALIAAAAIIYIAKFVTVPSQTYVAFIGNSLVLVVLIILFHRHRDAIHQFYKRHYPVLRHRPKALLMLLATLSWAISAIGYQSELLGFFTVVLTLSWLGFGIMVTPLQYAFGFQNRKGIVRGTSGAFILVIIYALVAILKPPIPHYSLFATGIEYMGTIVLFIGILIVSSKWSCRYYEFNYLAMQFLAIGAGLLALYVGSVYNLGTLRGIGGTFVALYLIEKQFEFPWTKKRAAWLLLLLGITLYGIAHVISTYPEYFFMLATAN